MIYLGCGATALGVGCYFLLVGGERAGEKGKKMLFGRMVCVGGQHVRVREKVGSFYIFSEYLLNI